MELLTPAEYAARTGLSARTVRERAATGRIPGAQRAGSPGSPWVLPWPPTTPGTDTTPPLVRGGVARDEQRHDEPGHAQDAAYGIPDALTTYAACVSAVSGVTTRPARALPAALGALLASIARHSVDRDGACSACGWTFPCPDAATAATALHAVAGVVLDGAE